MKYLFILLLLIFGLQNAYSQNDKPDYKFSLHTTWLTFSNFGNPETNTHHYEIRFSYQLTSKDQVGIKLATWKLFAPLGMDIWASEFLDRTYFYPGRLRETGFGITYQRRFWKGLFATLEVMPMITKYLNQAGDKIGNGFKLYNSYHLGYHIPLFKKGRFFIEPQLHVNHWPINNNVPATFKVEEDRWDHYFFVEPNLYLGFKF